MCSLIAVSGCKNTGQLSPQGYALDKPHRIELGKALHEISGISFNPADSSILAIGDDKEKVIQISLKSKKLVDYTSKVLESGSDLEDIVTLDSSVFLLMSKGILVEVPQKAQDTSGVKMYHLGLAGNNDFETVYHDPSAAALVLLCKTCAREKGEGVRTTYKFDLRSKTFDDGSFFTISKQQVKDLLKNADAEFEPSAAAIHPVTRRLFILSSAGHLLVITDTRGQVLEAYTLNPDVFPQAEGIAFAPNGDMYISNEGKSGRPTLLRFAYHQTRK